MRPQIVHDAKTGLYLTEHAGISYYVPYELVAGFRNFHARSLGTTADWYQDLPMEDRKKVKREGISKAPDDFYPDREY